MSRLSRFFLKGSASRTYAETLVLFLALLLFTIVIYDSEAKNMYVASLLFLINPCWRSQPSASVPPTVFA